MPALEAGSHAAADATDRLPRTGLVRQEITIEGLDRDELFFVAPFVALKANSDINRRSRPAAADALRLRPREHVSYYVLGTTAIVDGVQQPLTPARTTDATAECPGMPKSTAPTPCRTSWRWPTAGSTNPACPRKIALGRARYLERQLAALGAVPVQPGRPAPRSEHRSDRRLRHQASARTLRILRHRPDAHAPQPGHSGADGGRLQVRRDGTTWAASIRSASCTPTPGSRPICRPSQLPAELMHGRDYWPWSDRCGGWLRLDPTPGGAGAPAAIELARAGPRTRRTGSISAWSNYVVELDCRASARRHLSADRRRLRRRAAGSRPMPGVAGDVRRTLVALLHLGPTQRRGGLVWRPLAAAFARRGTSGRRAAGSLWRVGRRLWRRWDGKPRPAAAAAGVRSRVLSPLRDACWPGRAWFAPPAQTQREFAAAAGARLARRRAKTAWPPARRGGRGLLPRPFRPPTPRQPPGPGGRTCAGRN